MKILILSLNPLYPSSVAYGLKSVKKNTHITYLSYSVSNPISRFSSDIDAFVYCSNKEDIVSKVISIIQRDNIDLLYPVDLFGSELCMQNKEIFLQHTKLIDIPTLESFHIAKNKWRLSQFLNTNGCNVSRGAEHNDNDDLTYPILLKPSEGAAGNGIEYIKNKEAYEKLDKLKEKVFFEEFIEGFDIICNVYCKNGVVVAHTFIKPKFFGDKGFTSHFDIHEFYEDAGAMKLVSECMLLLKWNGIACIDVRYSTKTHEYYIIEINPRFWATLTTSLAAGVNFPYILMQGKVDEKSKGNVETTTNIYSLKYIVKKGLFIKNPFIFKSSEFGYRLHNIYGTFREVTKNLFKKLKR